MLQIFPQIEGRRQLRKLESWISGRNFIVVFSKDKGVYRSTCGENMWYLVSLQIKNIGAKV